MAVVTDQTETCETPCDFMEFLHFATQLNIPLNEDYLCRLKAFRMKTGNSLNETLTVFEHGLKGGKYIPSDMSNERRIQNALWREWGKQRWARLYHATLKEIPDKEGRLGEVACPPKSELSLVRGEDIPTEYTMPALRAHELAVIGTYVDKKIIPGFAYRVHLNGSEDYLFSGQALVLESIGQGYGKRLTFKSQDTINNNNFFWSDSNPGAGFGFAIQVVYEGDKFGVFDSADRKVAEATVNNVRKEQEILSFRVESDCVVTEVYVCDMQYELSFCTDVHVPRLLQGQNIELKLSGIAVATKQHRQREAKLAGIKTVIPPMGTCFMCKY